MTLNNPDADMIERSEQKERATTRIADAIATIETQSRQPDPWERVFLAQAVAALFAGAYRLAEVDAALSLTPTEQRSPFPNLPSDAIFDRCNIALLRAALQQAELEVVSRFLRSALRYSSKNNSQHACLADMSHRPLDPRKCPIGIDANALNRNGSTHDALVDRLLELYRTNRINLIVPHGVRLEAQDPRTPHAVSESITSKIFTIPTSLTSHEQDTRRRIEAALQGNARPGKHSADAQHLAEAAKYCGYFITHDERILKKSQGLASLLPPSLNVVTLTDFLQIFDDYEAGRRV